MPGAPIGITPFCGSSVRLQSRQSGGQIANKNGTESPFPNIFRVSGKKLSILPNRHLAVEMAAILQLGQQRKCEL